MTISSEKKQDKTNKRTKKKMARELAGSAILAAVKHRANHKPIIFCSLSLIAVGILMTIFGIIVLLLDHTEMGPPVYDSQYERYAGSSLAHILGPMFIGFGSLIVVGNFFMLAYASRAYYMNSKEQTTDSKQRIAAHKSRHGITLI